MPGHIIISIGKWGINHVPTTPKRFQEPHAGDIIDFGEDYKNNPYPYNTARYGMVDSHRPQWGHGHGRITFCCHIPSAFLTESGSVSMSGGPFGSCYVEDLIPAWTTYPARFWNWGNNMPGGDMGVHFSIDRPVFKMTIRRTDDNHM